MGNQTGIIIFVRNFSGCVEFYRDQIDLKVMMEKPGITKFQFGSMYLQFEDSERLKAVPTENIILRENVHSITAKKQELSRKGIQLEVYDLEWGEIGFVFDPHGNKLEFFREK